METNHIQVCILYKTPSITLFQAARPRSTLDRRRSPRKTNRRTCMR